MQSSSTFYSNNFWKKQTFGISISDDQATYFSSEFIPKFLFGRFLLFRTLNKYVFVKTKLLEQKSSQIIEIVNARRLAIIYAQLELPQVRIFNHLLPFWFLLSFYDHLNKNVIHFKPDLYLKVYLEKLSSKHPFHLFWNFYVVDRFLTVSFVDVYIAYARLLCPIWLFPGSGLTIRADGQGWKIKLNE